MINGYPIEDTTVRIHMEGEPTMSVTSEHPESKFITVTNEQYHGDLTRVGHSMLETFRESPVTYGAMYVHKTMKHPSGTPAMCLGTALHAMLLETDQYDELIAVAPDVDRRTKDGKLQWEYFTNGAGDRTVITQDQNEIVTAMSKSVLAHPEAKKLFAKAEHREKALFWTNEATGIKCKCKPDLYWEDGALIGDLKTAASPEPGPWSRQAASLGYARQNAWYCVGGESVTGRTPKFMHVVVGTSEPFECCCYFMETEWVQKGEFQNQADLNALQECMGSGVWLAPQNREIRVVQPPRWAMME